MIAASPKSGLQMKLQAYLDRIGFKGAVRADVPTLNALHRAQALTVPYEACDVFLGRPVSQHLPDLYRKIVEDRRGGWCYEANRLLAWAIEQAGFTVQLATAGVYRRERGDSAWGNHVVLLIEAEGQRFLGDLGLGDALRLPMPLVEGDWSDGLRRFRLERLDSETWRFWNHAQGDPGDFDFRTGPANESLIAERHAAIQADPSSVFRKTFQVYQMGNDGVRSILGRVLRTNGPEGETRVLIPDAASLGRHLADDFGLGEIDTAAAWPLILARHAEIFGAEDYLPGSGPLRNSVPSLTRTHDPGT